jgi:hypothetical protein
VITPYMSPRGEQPATTPLGRIYGWQAPSQCRGVSIRVPFRQVNGADLVQSTAANYADRRARCCRKCYKFSMQRSPRS